MLVRFAKLNISTLSSSSSLSPEKNIQSNSLDTKKQDGNGSNNNSTTNPTIPLEEIEKSRLTRRQRIYF